MLRIALKPLRCAALLLPLLLASCAAQTFNYTAYPTGCFKFHLERTDWGTARQICEAEGAYLGVINSDAEAEDFMNLFVVPADYSEWCFVGFHDLFLEGQYLTVLGDDLANTGYNKWKPGQPNNENGNEDCGTFTKRDGTALLNDYNCDISTVFICEKELAEGEACK